MQKKNLENVTGYEVKSNGSMTVWTISIKGQGKTCNFITFFKLQKITDFF